MEHNFVALQTTPNNKQMSNVMNLISFCYTKYSAIFDMFAMLFQK